MSSLPDSFRRNEKIGTEFISDDEIKLELLRRAIAYPYVKRVSNVIPIAVIALTALSIPQRNLMWTLVLLLVFAIVGAAYTAQRAKTAIETGKRQDRAITQWLTVEFIAAAIWGLMLLPISDFNLPGPERAMITSIIMVTISAGCMVSANANGLPKAIVIGFTTTALPSAVVYYTSYTLLLVGTCFMMILGLLHLVKIMQQDAMRSLRTGLENERLTARLGQALDVAQYLSRHDSLTGLLNRRDFEASVQLMRLQNMKSNVVIILFDLDHFKAINDEFGHATGDLVLKAAANAAHSQIRVLDIVAGEDEAVARWGGEEFVIALANVTTRDAQLVAERIRIAITNVRCAEIPKTLTLSASFGIASWAANESLNQAIARADLAMFNAKAAGRNCIRTAINAEANDLGASPSSHV